MSGAEVIAGLVLGGFPILTEALQGYRECFKVLECWLEFEAEYLHCQRRINELELEYELILYKVYEDCEEELELAKLTPGDTEVWAGLEKRLEQRLMPKVFETYRNLLRDICAAMDQLKVQLGYKDSHFQDRRSEVRGDVLFNVCHHSC